MLLFLQEVFQLNPTSLCYRLLYAKQKPRIKSSFMRGLFYREPSGAEGETRTPTNIRLLVPETSASTNSATSAYNFYNPEKGLL